MIDFMRKILLAVIMLAWAIPALSQKKALATIKGKIVDTTDNQPLKDATISLILKSDSSSAAFAISDAKGLFELKNIEEGTYELIITYTGYAKYQRGLLIGGANPSADIGTVTLSKKSDMLDEVIVTRPPIIIKKDTIEFNASAFKTKPNAVVEDLLKKLPGVEVDKDGNITSQGEAIQKVYVDGKEFFTNDPKLATKNLTADIVESIQVFDDMSEQSKFTKIDDGSKQRAINIKLKKDKKKGYFGRITAGAGTSERYEASGNLNLFKDKTQISILGGANNVNRMGFTFTDAISGMGGMAAGGARRQAGNSTAANGNTSSWSGGLNYRDQWGSKMTASGNYFISNNSTLTRNDSYRQTFFPNDSIAYSAENGWSKNSNTNHRINFRWEYQIDSMNSIMIIPNINFQHSESYSFDTLNTRATKTGVDYTAITGRNNTSNIRDGYNINNNLLYRHRFHKAGRTLTVGWTTGINHSDGTGYTESPYVFYNADGTVNRLQNLDQNRLQTTNSNNNTISTSFTEGIGKNKVVELNYAYTNNRSTSDRQTFDYNNATEKFDVINKQQTNYFENDFISSRAGLTFRLRETKYDFQLGGAVQVASIENKSFRAMTGKDSLMKQTYTNFFPNANFNYNLGTRKSIRFNYRGRTNAPTVSQLQDVPDVSNPLRVRTGNPNLKQEFTNNFDLSYNTFNVSNFMFFTTNISAGTTSNRIVNSIDTLGKSVQFIKPENVDGSYNVSMFSTLGIPLKKAATGKKSPLNLNLTTSLRYNRDVSLLYKQKNFSNTMVANQRINFNMNIKEKFDLGANANFTYNNTTYTIQQNLNNKYFAHSYSLDLSYTVAKSFILATDFDYYINTGRASGYNQRIPLWSASFSKQVFKKKNGQLRLAVQDILNQNQSISRNIGDNYIEDSRTQVLQRYFMLSFTYNVGKFGGPQQQRRMGAPMQGGGNFQRRN